MNGQKTESIGDREARLWHKGALISWAYLYDVDGFVMGPIGGRKVSRKLLDDFQDRLEEAKGRKLTGRKQHHALGELGELFAAIMFGIKLHDPYTQGSDGMLGNDYVEVKTITPAKKRGFVLVKRSGNFSRLVVVKITNDFQFGARMVSRSILKKGHGLQARLSWDEMLAGAGERVLELNSNFPIVRPPPKVRIPATPVS